MRILGFLLLCLSVPLFASTTLKTQIHDVDYGTLPGDDVLVFLKSGHVVKLPEWNQDLIQTLQSAKSNANWFNFTIDAKRNIVDATPASAPIVSEEPLFEGPEEKNYLPTTVASLATARKYMAESRHNAREHSQCFNRAMVWTYEWWKKHSLRSNKMLVYWSKEYVRRYGHEWWFHIAPYVHVMNDQGQVVERILDVKYSSRPMDFQSWTDMHSPKNAVCNVINKFSEYANYPWDNDCYLQRTNMYTWMPADLEMNEAWGYTKTAFNLNEVKAAYLDGFGLSWSGPGDPGTPTHVPDPVDPDDEDDEEDEEEDDTPERPRREEPRTDPEPDPETDPEEDSDSDTDPETLN